MDVSFDDHVALTICCGICGTAFVPGDSCIALLGTKEDPAAFQACLNVSPFPEFSHNLCRVRGVSLCRRDRCWRCLQSGEACTVHTDCLHLFQRQFGARAGRARRYALARLWVAAAWRSPWRQALCLYRPPDGLLSEAWLREGGSRVVDLQRLPPELIERIRLHCADSPLWRFGAALDLARELSCLQEEEEASAPVTAMSLSSVCAWHRGSLPETTDNTAAPPPPLVRLTVDARGLRRIERLSSVSPLSSRRSERQAYAVVDAGLVAQVMVYFKYGHARLQHATTPPDLRFWDTPTPPSLDACLFHPVIPTLSTCFYSIDLDYCSGLTFFVSRGAIYAIHVHTDTMPCAEVTFAQLPTHQQRFVDWVYMPVAAGDRVTAVAIRQSGVDFRRFCFVFHMQLAGEVAVVPRFWGRMQDTFLSRTPPITLFYNSYHLPESQAITCFGAYIGDSGSSGTEEGFGRLPEHAPPFRHGDFSWAPLAGVVIVQVFLDESRDWCRGLLVVYKNGGQRALGHCRVGVDPVCTYAHPTRLCWQTTGRAVRFKAGGDEADHTDESWQSSPLVGNLYFWTTGEEMDIAVGGWLDDSPPEIE